MKHSILVVRYDPQDPEALAQYEAAKTVLMESGSGVFLSHSEFYVENEEASRNLQAILHRTPACASKLSFVFRPCSPGGKITEGPTTDTPDTSP